MAAIHPIWAIDEYARIFRSWVWLRPPQPPSRIDMRAEEMIKGWLMVGEICMRIESGAIFCQVSKIIADKRVIPCVTSGTQKWNGASPSFIMRDRVMMVEIVWFCEYRIDHCPDVIMVMIIVIRRIIDADAWVKKYLAAASVERGVDLFSRIGIMESMFISRPIHIRNQCQLDSVIRVPVISVV